jgi:hypothetical protein
MAKFASAQTHGSVGTTYVPFTDLQGISLAVINNTGTELQFRRSNDTTPTFELKDGQAWEFPLSANAKEIEVRRTDNSTSQVTVKGEVTP